MVESARRFESRVWHVAVLRPLPSQGAKRSVNSSGSLRSSPRVCLEIEKHARLQEHASQMLSLCMIFGGTKRRVVRRNTKPYFRFVAIQVNMLNLFRASMRGGVRGGVFTGPGTRGIFFFAVDQLPIDFRVSQGLCLFSPVAHCTR